MKPFNLERALAGDPVITRTGKKVTQIHYENTSITHPVTAFIEGQQSWKCFCRKGTLFGIYDPHDFDLFMASKTVKTDPYRRYICIDGYNDGRICMHVANPSVAELVSKSRYFVKWIDEDWVTHEVEV